MTMLGVFALLPHTSVEASFFTFIFWPVFVMLLLEIDKTLRIGQVRLMEIGEIVLVHPVMLGVMVSWNSLLLSTGGFSSGNSGDDKARVTKIMASKISVVLIAIYMYGNGMHFSTNLLHTFLTEWAWNLENGISKDSVPPKFYNLLYFFDEYLSHFLIFTSLYALLLVLIVWGHETHETSRSHHHPNHLPSSVYPPAISRTWYLSLLGVGGGLTHAVGMIEGSSVTLAALLAVLLIGLSLFVLVVAKKRSGHIAHVYYGLFHGSAIVVSLIAYYFTFQGFIAPSEMGGWWAVVHRMTCVVSEGLCGNRFFASRTEL